jgi:hypothetical protein
MRIKFFHRTDEVQGAYKKPRNCIGRKSCERNSARRGGATVAFLLAVLSISPPLFAQATVRVNIPGAAFSPEGRSGQIAIEDVAGGRRFRGRAGELMILRAVLQMPPSSSADPKLQRLIIRFRTSASGPSLRAVELLNGDEVEYRFETYLKGDYSAGETTSNMWVFEPTRVSPESALRLEIQFPIGFDSPINPGEFFLSAVATDFARKAMMLPRRHLRAGAWF